MLNLNGAKQGSVFTFNYPCGEDKTTYHPIVGSLPGGIYKFDVYGTEGGKANGNSGGYGGFSTGILRINYPVKVYLI